MKVAKPVKPCLFLRTVALTALFVWLQAAGYSGQEKAYTLEEIISLGLEHNPRIAANAFEVEARESAYQASRRLFNPELQFTLGRAEAHDALSDRRTFSLAISQPIENPFRRHHRIEIERNIWEESLQIQAFQVLEITYEIKIRFYSLLLLQERELLLESIAGSVREMERLVRRRAELGEIKPLDAIKLRVEVLKAENEIAALRSQIEQGRENLSILLGNVLPPDFKIRGRLEFHPVPLDEAALADRALAIHPRIQASVKQLEQKKNTVLFVKRQRFPGLALTGFSDTELDGVNRGVGITLTIPLWNFGSNEVAEALNLARMSEQELGAARLELAREIRAAVRRVRLAQKTLSTYTTALLRQVEESLEIAEVSYREGEISLLDFLDSQRTYYSVRGDYFLALFNWNAEMAALEKAAGARIQ